MKGERKGSKEWHLQLLTLVMRKHDMRDALCFCIVVKNLFFQLHKTFMFLLSVIRNLGLALVMFRANVEV